MAVKCVLFDADGVLVDSERFSTIYRDKFGVSEDDMLPFFDKEFRDCLVGKGDLKELVRPLLSKWKWKGTAEEFLDFWLRACNDVDSRMKSAIRRLRNKGFLCCLATNQEKYRAGYMRKDMGFEELFDHVFTSAEIGHKKPDKEFFEHVLKMLKEEYGLEPGDIMFFDDMQEHVDSARKAGIDAHVYRDFDGFESKINQLLKKGKNKIKRRRQTQSQQVS